MRSAASSRGEREFGGNSSTPPAVGFLRRACKYRTLLSPRTSTMADEAGSRPPFVGRSETVDILHRRFEDARAGAGGVTLLVGGTGVGKSALVAALAEEIRARGDRVLVGKAPALDAPPPFSLVRSAFQSAQERTRPSANESSRLGGEPFLIGFAPGLGAPSGDAPVDIDEWLLEALGETENRGGMARERVLTGIADQILKFTQQGPTVLILEDLNRADESSLAAVEVLAKELEHQPLWILATTRPFGTLTEVGRSRLERFESATHARQVPLRPLSPGEVAEYLRVNDPTRIITPEEVTRRHSESGGNPLLLQQLDGRVSTGAVPGEGLSRLDEEAHRLLEVAAVLGTELPFDLLLRASGEDEERLTEVVDRLVGQGLLLEWPGELLAFPEDRLRGEVYDHLAEDRRRLLHRRAGEALEGLGTADVPTVYALARHFYLGQSDERSLQYNRLAAELAERALAPDDARSHFARALESQRRLDPDDIEGESNLVLQLGSVSYELGRLEEAEGVLGRFLDRTKEDPRLSARFRATLEILLAQVLSARGDVRASARLAETLLSSPELEGDTLVRIGAHHQLGLSLYYEGRYPESLAHHTEELRLAREVGNERVIAHALMWHSGVLAMLGQPDPALVEAREVAAMLDRTGSAADSAQGHLFLGNMLADNRSTPRIREEALAELRETVRWGIEAQDPRRVGWAFYHTAELLREEGQFEEAAEKAQWAYDTLGRIGDQAGQSVSIKVRGQAAMARGDYDQAEADLLEAHRLLGGLRRTLWEIDVVLRLAQLSFARGDLAGARNYVTELERENLMAARPDLAGEFRQLQDSLATQKGDRA